MKRVFKDIVALSIKDTDADCIVSTRYLTQKEYMKKWSNAPHAIVIASLFPEIFNHHTLSDITLNVEIETIECEISMEEMLAVGRYRVIHD